MLILTLFPRHPLMLHRPAPSSYLVSTRRPLPGASCHCHAVCCVCQRVGLIMKLLNQPSWTGHWLHQLPAAAAGRGEPEFKFSRLSAGAAGAARRQLGRCGRGGAGRAGQQQCAPHTSLVPATPVSTPPCSARPSAHLRHRDTIAHTAACVRVLPAAQPHCTN